MRFNLIAATLALGLASPGVSFAAVIINEFVYDDGGTDDREFVELYNNGNAAVDIGGWTLGGQDANGANTSVAITAGTVVNPGAYYVIGDTGTLNVNQVIAAGFLENDAETVELRNGGVLVDAVVYEANKGTASHGVLPVDVAGDVGPGIWGNNQSSDLSGSPLNATASVARFVDGRDNNNNGFDFGVRPSTPGTSNNPTNITAYSPPDVSVAAVGSDVPGFGYSFVAPRVIDPSVADANNPNVIPPAPSSSNRAIVAWDSSGGGNAASAAETFNTPEAAFDVFAYFDTRDLPEQSNATGVTFRGSEISVFGIGGVDSLNNLTDISGEVGVPDSANGTTGVAWVYEKVGETSANPGAVSEKLYLVDAGDGGDAGQGGSLPFDWTILATVDLSSISSGWYRLGIDVDVLGDGKAWFDNQLFNFSTNQLHGAFGVAYRENLQLGSDGTPDAIMRPPTFAAVPEPNTVMILAMIAIPVLTRRRR